MFEPSAPWPSEPAPPEPPGSTERASTEPSPPEPPPPSGPTAGLRQILLLAAIIVIGVLGLQGLAIFIPAVGDFFGGPPTMIVVLAIVTLVVLGLTVRHQLRS